MANISTPWVPLEERDALALFTIPLTPEENERYSDEDIYEQFDRVGRPECFPHWLPRLRGEIPMGAPFIYE